MDADDGNKKYGVLCYPTAIGNNWKIEASSDIDRDGTVDILPRGGQSPDGSMTDWLLN